MAKEGKSNFELKKGKRFQFDLSKNPKRVFDLVKDVDETPEVVDSIPTLADTTVKASQSLANPTTPESQIQMVPIVTSPDKEKSQSSQKPKPATKKDEGKSGKQGIKQLNNQNNTAKQPKGTVFPQKPIAPAETDVKEESGNEGVGSNKWMWIVGAILVVAIIAWLCMRGCSSSNDNGATTEPTVEAVESTEASEEEAVIEEPTAEGEAEQPTSSDVVTESPATVAEEATLAEVSASTDTPSETAAAATTTTPTSTSATATSETASKPSGDAVSGASSSQTAEVSSDIEAEAMKVIRGVYGTGIERKLKLGSKYREIQNRVNELKRQGAF